MMGTITAPQANSRHVTSLVRRRIERGGERVWRLADFHDLSFPAVAQALSRLARAGVIERLSKGVYYRTRDTAFGKSKVNPAALRELASRQTSMFPSGVAAASLLGFTTQNPRRGELATCGSSLPRKLVGQDILIHTRRPEAWANLSAIDAALLDFLRGGAKTSELEPEETIRRTLILLLEEGRYKRLTRVADTEPPRVRAVLGALGEHLGMEDKIVARLRGSLNPLSRFDLGPFAVLPNARAWQTKGRR